MVVSAHVCYGDCLTYLPTFAGYCIDHQHLREDDPNEDEAEVVIEDNPTFTDYMRLRRKVGEDNKTRLKSFQVLHSTCHTVLLSLY